MKSTFWEISQRLIKEDAPMGGGAPPMGGDIGGSSPMGGGAPPMGGGTPMGGSMPPLGGGPPMGGGMGGPPMGDIGMGGPPMGGTPGNPSSQKTFELQPTDVWTIINNILDGKKISSGKKTDQSKSNPLQSSGLNQ